MYVCPLNRDIYIYIYIYNIYMLGKRKKTATKYNGLF